MLKEINSKSVNQNEPNAINIPQSPPKPDPVKLLPLNENSIKRIRKLLNLDKHELTGAASFDSSSSSSNTQPNRPSPFKSKRAPIRTKTAPQHDLIVLNANSIVSTPTQIASTKSMPSSSSSSTSSSSSSSNRMRPRLATHTYHEVATRAIDDDYDENDMLYQIQPIRITPRVKEDCHQSMIVPPSTPLVYSLDDSVLVDDCCLFCQHEQIEAASNGRIFGRNGNNNNRRREVHGSTTHTNVVVKKRNRVLVPKVTSSLMSLNSRQLI